MGEPGQSPEVKGKLYAFQLCIFDKWGIKFIHSPLIKELSSTYVFQPQ
jgi:hypothetical protein